MDIRRRESRVSIVVSLLLVVVFGLRISTFKIVDTRCTCDYLLEYCKRSLGHQWHSILVLFSARVACRIIFPFRSFLTSSLMSYVSSRWFGSLLQLHIREDLVILRVPEGKI